MRNIGRYLVIGAIGFFSELNYPGNCVRCSNNLMLRPRGYGGYRAYTKALQWRFGGQGSHQADAGSRPQAGTPGAWPHSRGAMLLAENNTDARLFCTAAWQAGTA